MVLLANKDGLHLKAVNTKQPLNIFRMKENLNLAIQSCKGIGCVVISIDAETIIKGTEHLILGLVWQIIRIQMLGKIDLKHHPFLIRLLKNDEELDDLLKLPKEELLLRWINYHLKNAGYEKEVKNFGDDLKDGTAYIALLN